MKKFIEHLKNLRDIYGLLVFFVGVVIGGHQMYIDITDKIDSNRNATETTQIMILKKYVRDFEKGHSCKVSDAEWDEYIINYSTLFDLQKKHKMLSKDATWLPIERKHNSCKE